jgi:hypothetical protein
MAKISKHQVKLFELINKLIKEGNSIEKSEIRNLVLDYKTVRDDKVFMQLFNRDKKDLKKMGIYIYNFYDSSKRKNLYYVKRVSFQSKTRNKHNVQNI